LLWPGASLQSRQKISKLSGHFRSLKLNDWVSGHPVLDSGPTPRHLSNETTPVLFGGDCIDPNPAWAESPKRSGKHQKIFRRSGKRPENVQQKSMCLDRAITGFAPLLISPPDFEAFSGPLMAIHMAFSACHNGNFFFRSIWGPENFLEFSGPFFSNKTRFPVISGNFCRILKLCPGRDVLIRIK
jgi:hypothetical protein